MSQDDLDFWIKSMGFSGYYQLLESLDLAHEILKSIKRVCTGYNYNNRITMLVSGTLESGKEFTAVYYLSKNWTIPGESVDSLQELRIW